MRNAFVNTIIEASLKEDDIFIISGDAGLGVFDDFQKHHPERFLNLGVAEQNAISVAAGMALAGYRVYVYNIVPFVLYRCYEQVRNDICYQHLPVTLIGIGSGLTYAPQGMTHYSVEDLGIAQTLPGLRVFSPADPTEAEDAARITLADSQPTYVRLAKRGEPRIHAGATVDASRPIRLAEGHDVTIVFHGTVANEAMSAHELLREQGISARVVSLPQVDPCNYELINAAAAGTHDVVTVEEHFVNSGLGARLAFWHAANRPDWRLSCLGITPEYIHAIKKQDGMRSHYGISASHIATHVRELMNHPSGAR